MISNRVLVATHVQSWTLRTVPPDHQSNTWCHGSFRWILPTSTSMMDREGGRSREEEDRNTPPDNSLQYRTRRRQGNVRYHQDSTQPSEAAKCSQVHPSSVAVKASRCVTLARQKKFFFLSPDKSFACLPARTRSIPPDVPIQCWLRTTFGLFSGWIRTPIGPMAYIDTWYIST